MDYCEHGFYVGGSGIDWICPYCEDGISMKELFKIHRREQKLHRRTLRLIWLRDWMLRLCLRAPNIPGRRFLIDTIMAITIKCGR